MQKYNIFLDLHFHVDAWFIWGACTIVRWLENDIKVNHELIIIIILI